MKFGYQGNTGGKTIARCHVNSQSLRYTFVWSGVPFFPSPSRVHQRLQRERARGRTSFYAQDQWTLKRLTLQGALRFDHPWSWFPAQTEPASRFFPGASFAAGRWRDRLQRHHAAPGCRVRPVRQRQDGAEGERSASTCRAPASATSPTARTRRCGSLDGNTDVRRHLRPVDQRRNWTDANRNFIPDCNLTNPLAQGPANGSIDNCGQIDNLHFGSRISSSARTSIRACSPAGASVRRTGRSACRCSSRSSRARRWRSATTAARSRSTPPAAR